MKIVCEECNGDGFTPTMDDEGYIYSVGTCDLCGGLGHLPKQFDTPFKQNMKNKK